jgi:uncharacterized protein YxeA
MNDLINMLAVLLLIIHALLNKTIKYRWNSNFDVFCPFLTILQSYRRVDSKPAFLESTSSRIPSSHSTKCSQRKIHGW